MVHDKIKDVQCPQCDYCCSTNGNLKEHIKQVHDRIKDVKCPQCDYKCSRNGTLKKHIKTCTGEMKCSSGEFAIIQVLDELNVDYIFNQSCWGVKDKRLLQWDFVINPTADTPAVIEYDGKFHFKPIRMGNMNDEEAKEVFESTQRRDKIKDDYCDDNDIFMMRIPYWAKHNISALVRQFVNDCTF
jgi:hypothetical protein